MVVRAPWSSVLGACVLACVLACVPALSPLPHAHLPEGRLAAPTAAEADSTPKGEGGPQNRLPLTALPDSYTLDLDVDLAAGTFTGKVVIALRPVKQVDFLTFNVDLDVIAMTTVTLGVSGLSGLPIPKDHIEEDKTLQMVTIRWDGSTIPNNDDKPFLVPGKTYDLTISYTGKLRSDMYGFYKSTYKNGAQDILMAATQFEPTHARSAFPCWDEPHYKATFTLSVTHARSLRALSNRPGTRQDISNSQRTKTTFSATPKMSTYLVAFVVSDFVQKAANLVPATTPATATTPASASASTSAPDWPDATSVSYSVWVRPGQEDQAEYAVSVGPLSLRELEKFTGINYSSMGLGKLDLIAIPDFAAGAMENWGLITFRETGLMYTKGESTEAARESIALVIAHEQTHMWFGDLVSPDWWGFAWLNEGFARYLQYVSMDLVQPDWRLMDTFVVRTLQGALAFDALKSTHPMSATVYTPDAIQGIFDRISYDKGASVLHMTRNVLGDTKFKAALNDYLSKKRSDTAMPYDLFKAFDRAVTSDTSLTLPKGLTMAVALEAWTQEEGYPVVTLRTVGGKTTITQERFLSSQTECTSDNTRWWVPLTYTVQGGSFDPPKTVWLDPRNTDTSLDDQVPGWILANIKQTGFFRVNYDDENWARLAELLRTENSNVPILNRAQMLDDALSLARAGLLKYPVALNITRYLSTEKDPIPWTAALSHLDFLGSMLAGDSAQTAFNKYVLELISAAYTDVGFAGDEDAEASKNHLKLTFRPTLLGEACRLGMQDCVDKAKEAFKAFISSSKTVPASQRSTVYCMGVRYGTASDWDALWNRYVASTTSVGEKSIILGALGCTNDADTLDKYLGYSLDASKVRAQDASAVFTAVLSGGDANLDRAFDFFTNNFDKMNTAYGGWSSMQNVINGLAGKIVDETRLKKLEDFLTSKSSALGVAKAAAVRSLETARANLAWRQQHLKTVSDWVLNGASLTLYPIP